MTTQVSWTRKYRPRKLTEYVGNENVIQTVNKLIERNRLPQTLIFSGERGTGKTSLARLIGKSLLCTDETTNEACDSCDACTLFNTRYFLTGEPPRELAIYEYDITKLNRREDASNIVERMRTRTLGGSKRIFILDEIQRATSEAQSSFLKIAEEPPEGVYIILCTTNPEQLLVPLKSRFHTFMIKRPSITDLIDRIEYICQQEGVSFQKRAIRLIVDTLQNNPRESITKAELYGLVGSITMEQVTSDLSIISDTTYRKFIQASREGNINYVANIVEEFRQDGDKSVKEFIVGFGEYMAELLKIRNGVNVERYTASELSANRTEIQNYTDDQIIDILCLINKYSNASSDEYYTLLTLGAELIKVMKVIETPEANHIPEEEVLNNYSDVTQDVNDARPTPSLPSVEDHDLLAIFGTQIKKVEI